MDDERKPKAPAPGIVDMLVGAENKVAPVAYWCWTILAVVTLSFDAVVVVMFYRNGHPWMTIAIVGLGLGAIAATVYFLGWGWRWVFTRRVDHLFGNVKLTSDRMEPARKRWARILSLIFWLPM